MKNQAPFLSRLVAFAIDFLVTLLVYSIPLLSVAMATNAVAAIDHLLTALIYWLLVFPLLFLIVQSLCITKLGGTIGKLLSGTEIVDSQGKFLSLPLALFRQLIGYTVSGMFFGLGFWWMLRGNDKRTWHDLLTDTYVVVKEQSGLVLGSIVLVVLLLSNGLLWKNVVEKYLAHQDMYQEAALDVMSTMGEKMEDAQRKELRNDTGGTRLMDDPANELISPQNLPFE